MLLVSRQHYLIMLSRNYFKTVVAKWNWCLVNYIAYTIILPVKVVEKITRIGLPSYKCDQNVTNFCQICSFV